MLCISDRQIDRTVQEAASGNDTLTGNCVHKSADFFLVLFTPEKQDHSMQAFQVLFTPEKQDHSMQAFQGE